jgi:hypothetical protein
MMMGLRRIVNPRTVDDVSVLEMKRFVLEMKISGDDEPAAQFISAAETIRRRKKAGLKRARLKVLAT